MSLFLSFSLPPCLSFSVVLSLYLSRSCLSFFFPVLSLFLSFRLCDSLCIFLPHLLLSFSLSLSLSSLSLSLCLCISLISLSLSFSRPYLSMSLEPRSLFLFLSLSLFLSPPLLTLFSSFFLSLSLQSLSLCLCCSLSLFLPHLYPRSLSPTPVFLLIFLSHTLSLFPSFLFPSLSSSSLSPTYVSHSIFVSPLSLLLPLSGSLSPSLFHPYLYSYLSLSHRCLIFISFSLSLKTSI